MELSQNGTWVNLGTSQLVSVPYALVSGKSLEANRAYEATTLRDSAGNVFSVGYSNGQPTLVPAPGSGSASNPSSFACGQSVTYAGESYPTVQIGTQCWLAKNLNVGTLKGTWSVVDSQRNDGVIEKYCWGNQINYCQNLGGLYQWAEALQYQNGASNTTSPSPAFSGNVKGICPIGWHIPTDNEFCIMTLFLDSSVNCTSYGIWTGNSIGGLLKSTEVWWQSPNINATNGSGFNAQPHGYRDNLNGFIQKDGEASFWTTDENNSTNSIGRFLKNSNSQIARDAYEKQFGFSVRCLKD
jgi:uncharacterized protein (TIGR02145 family)